MTVKYSNLGLTRQDRDANFCCGGMAGWNEKWWWDAGFERSILDLHNCLRVLKRKTETRTIRIEFETPDTIKHSQCEQ